MRCWRLGKLFGDAATASLTLLPHYMAVRYDIYSLRGGPTWLQPLDRLGLYGEEWILHYFTWLHLLTSSMSVFVCMWRLTRSVCRPAFSVAGRRQWLRQVMYLGGTVMLFGLCRALECVLLNVTFTASYMRVCMVLVCFNPALAFLNGMLYSRIDDLALWLNIPHFLYSIFLLQLYWQIYTLLQEQPQQSIQY